MLGIEVMTIRLLRETKTLGLMVFQYLGLPLTVRYNSIGVE
ncbi:hypothetical protein [Homoserinibacter sp. YIM 151385]|nr:hypothetical protein [Homoserinibacter sp. YIM 151385]WBU37396.1 hypothetical protein OF852_10795 [Homoserinibacter sp. YIM 151385]